jgi:hypothetical protein
VAVLHVDLVRVDECSCESNKAGAFIHTRKFIQVVVTVTRS